MTGKSRIHDFRMSLNFVDECSFLAFWSGRNLYFVTPLHQPVGSIDGVTGSFCITAPAQMLGLSLFYHCPCPPARDFVALYPALFLALQAQRKTCGRHCVDANHESFTSSSIQIIFCRACVTRSKKNFDAKKKRQLFGSSDFTFLLNTFFFFHFFLILFSSRSEG